MTKIFSRKFIACLVAVIAAAAVATGVTLKKNTKMTDKTNAAAAQTADPKDALVEFHTSEGDFTVRLFGDTPKHRDNFLKLVREGYYDGVLFHRVINQFMVQTGDPDSKDAPAGKHLGSGGPGYTIEAEIEYPTHFQTDQVNPERRSSGSQFYIVTGKAYNDSTLAQMERQLVQMQKQQIFNELASQHRDSILNLRRNRDQAGLQALQDELVAITEKKVAENPAALTPEQKEAYTTVGGTPHLDNQYTVFGEVVSGMDVIDKIEKTATDSYDRPSSDIRIISTKIISDKK